MSVEPSKLKVRCPACKEWARWADNPFRPFCSKECRNVDLGNWATERYRIPVVEEEVEENSEESAVKRESDSD